MLSGFKDWLKMTFSSEKKRNELREERFSEEIIREDEERLRESYEKEIPASVITYLQENDETAAPVMDVIVDSFSGPILPEEGSVIWVDINGLLRPFKVIRYDYIQNSSEYDSMRLYIVVHPASKSDIVKQYYNFS